MELTERVDRQIQIGTSKLKHRKTETRHGTSWSGRQDSQRQNNLQKESFLLTRSLQPVDKVQPSCVRAKIFRLMQTTSRVYRHVTHITFPVAVGIFLNPAELEIPTQTNSTFRPKSLRGISPSHCRVRTPQKCFLHLMDETKF